MKWECYRCKYIFEGETPPDVCPSCHTQDSFWLEWFEFKSSLDHPVSKYMRKELYLIDANQNAWEAAKMMKQHNVGSLVVTVDGRPAGIVTERDMLYKITAEDLPAAHVLLHKIMSSPIVTVSAETPLRKALETMDRHNFRRLLVVENGRPLGLITQRSLIGDTLKGAVRTGQVEKPAD